MNITIRLGLPIVLGLAAFMFNWYILNVRQKTTSFTRIAADLRAGELFSDTNIEEFPVEGSLEAALGSAVPWAQSSVVYNQPAPRDLKAGDLVLWRDAYPPQRGPSRSPDPDQRVLPVSLNDVTVPQVLSVGDQISFIIAKRPQSPMQALIAQEVGTPAGGAFARERAPNQVEAKPTEYEVVGPFQILGVGTRFTRDIAGPADPNESSSASIVSVAIKMEGGKLDEKTSRLVSAADTLREDRLFRVTGVLLHPELATASSK